MKKMTLLFLPLLLLACGSKTEKADAVGQSSTDIALYDLHENGVNCVISAEQPGDTPWSLAVGEWLDERLGGCYDGNPRDMKALVEFYGQVSTDSLKSLLEDPNPDVELEFEATMTKEYETESFVTYTLSSYIGLGGAHPLSLEEGATFRKSDGRRLDWNIIRNDMRIELDELIKSFLMDYVEVANEEDLEPYLPGTDIYAIPLPQSPPYLLENGVAFIYQQYEIMGYAMGMPADTIAYERMMPLLTRNVQKLIEDSH
jgi:hypothetical protein